MQFLYFGTSGDIPQTLRYAFDRTPAKRQVLASGPGGQAGWIFSQIEANRIGFYADRQTWRRIPGGNNWIGFYTDDLPGPEDVARGKMLGGVDVQLGNGTWKVPKARALTSEDGDARWVTLVPRQLDLSEDGQWIYGQVVQQYRRLWEIGELWYAHRLAPDSEPEKLVDPQDALNMAAEVIGTNYRVSGIELAIIGVFSSANYERVLDVVIDFDTLLEHFGDQQQTEKKSDDSEQMNSPMYDGERDSTEATGLLLQT